MLTTTDNQAATVLITLATFGIGIVRTQVIPHSNAFSLTNVHSAEITNFPTASGDHWIAHAITSPSNHRVILRFTNPPPTYGDHITFMGKIRELRPPTNPGQPDFKKNFETRRIAALITVSNYTVIDHDLNNPIKRIAHHARNRVVDRVQSLLPPPYGDVLIALTLGDAGLELPTELSQAYRTAGLTHLLVVSGSQVALIIGIGTALIRNLSLPATLQVSVLTGLNLFFYCLCGGGASILRAVIMSELSLATQVIKSPSTPLHIISVTVIIFLLIDPTLVGNSGAILSFLATAALIWGVPNVVLWFPATWPNSVKSIVAMSIAPFLMTLPILWSQFYSISLISLIANLLVTPLIEAVVVVGIGAEAIAILSSSLGQWPLSFCHGVILLINKIAFTAASVPFASINVPRLPAVIAACLMAIIAVILIPDLIPRRKIKQIVTIGLGSIVCGFVITNLSVTNPIKIISIDVDQGDSTLIITPTGKTILIDAGNHIIDRKTGRTIFDAGTDRILPTLRYHGINQLDWLIITHFDQDHIGGVPSVIDGISVKRIYTNGNDARHPQWNLPPEITAESPDEALLQIEPGVTLHFISLKSKRLPKENDHSIIVKLTYQDLSYLMTGDLEADGEAILTNAFGTELESDILKLGHHGSKTSTTPRFLAAVSPQVGIISAGLNNHYGHPHPDVLRRIETARISHWGTFDHGAIIVESDGKTASLLGWKSGTRQALLIR